jgi:hypothetical protein
MGFSSLDNYLSEVTTNGKFWRADWVKNYTGGTVVAGRWYDLTLSDGVPALYTHGNYLENSNFAAGAMGWTLSAGMSWTPATQLVTKASSNPETITQNTACSNGVSYSVVYTIAGYTGSGNIVISLGGTNGTNRSANGTFRETISCGATANAPLTVSMPGTVTACTLDSIAVTRDLAFMPYTDTTVDCALWHGGNVSTDTKHIVNVGAWGNAVTSVPSILMIVDLLGVYPRIQTNTASLQTLNNSLTLPRYADGKGVRTFYVINTTNGANAQNFSMRYTNESDVSGRSLGAVVANTASAIAQHMSHSGIAASNFGPFLPLMGADQGIKSIQSCQFSAASASAGFIDLVLCKPLATIPLTTTYLAAERDLINQLPSLPRIYDGAVIGFLVFSGAVIAIGSQWQGYIDFAWGAA